MKRKRLKKEIRELITGKKEVEKTITFYYLNPETGETSLMHKVPDSKELDVTVDDPETAESLMKLRKPDK